MIQKRTISLHNRNSFSLIEIVFTIAIISVLLIVAVPKLDTILNNSTLVQVKSTVLLIREGINTKRNKLLLQNNQEDLETLDDGDGDLFSKILKSPIKQSTTPTPNGWVQVGQNSYQVYIENGEFVVFEYDNANYTFECDLENPYCLKVSQ